MSWLIRIHTKEKTLQMYAITPTSQKKHKNTGYFDKKYAVLIPNVTQFVQKAYIITI